MLFLTELFRKYESILHFYFVDNKLKYRLCKIQGNLTNFSAIFDCITPLCEIPCLISDQCRKQVSVIQGFLAPNFSGHDKEI